MNLIKQRDLLNGKKEEKRVKPILERFFNIELKNTTNNYVVDFCNNDNVFELKSRNNEHNKYPDTMIGSNKIEFAKKTKKNVYFVFSFTNGIYYWKYNPKNILIEKISGRKDRGKKEYKLYSYIPINWLIKINDEMN